MQIKATINKGSGVQRALAAAFLAISGAYVRAMRVVNGVSLKYARIPRPTMVYLFALATAVVLSPLHR